MGAACNGSQHVFTDRASLEEVSRDRSIHPPGSPLALVCPGTTGEVASCVRACCEVKIPFVVRGAGSGLEGGCVPYGGMVVISTDRLKGICMDEVSGLVDVGSGVRKDELNAFLRPLGLIFGPDPSSNPSLGGMAGTSGSGMTTLRYGTTRENVLSMVVVTPQGNILRTRRKVRKSSTSYDLHNLYIGSEGTLGIICELSLKVWPLPKIRVGGLIRFKEVLNACQFVVDVVSNQPQGLLRCELMNSEAIKCINTVYKTQLSEVPTISLELIAYKEEDAPRLEEQWTQIIGIAHTKGSTDHIFASDGSSLDDLWEARRGCYYAGGRYRKEFKNDLTFVTDVCVPFGVLATCVAETELDFKESQMPCVMCCHIADGNFHTLVPYQPHELPKVKALEHRLIERALRLGGTVSGEHGVGIGKIGHACKEHGDVHIACQQAIKVALDPLGLLNPGKMLPPQKAKL